MVTGPKPVRIGPKQRTTLRLETKATDVGVHALTLTPTTSDGIPVGTPLDVSLRTSQVGTFVWVVMGVGFGALVLLIIRRLLVRKKERTATDDGAADE